MDFNGNVEGEDPNKWLFVVKQHSLYHSKETGIACAVKKIVNRKPRVFLLTCKDTQSQAENIFAHCVCQRQWNVVQRWFHREHKPIDISSTREDDIFSFTPVEKCCTESLFMVSNNKDARKKLAEGLKDVCRSFVIAEDSFRTVRWLFQEEQGQYYLQNADLPKHDHEALGSPVLWTDDQNRSFVVGVVGYSTDGKLRPKFFTESALWITGKKSVMVSFPWNHTRTHAHPSPYTLVLTTLSCTHTCSHTHTFTHTHTHTLTHSHIQEQTGYI